MYEEAGKSDKAFQEIIDQARYLFRKNSVMIETDLSTHTTVSKLKDQEAFSKGMESVSDSQCRSVWRKQRGDENVLKTDGRRVAG